MKRPYQLQFYDYNHDGTWCIVGTFAKVANARNGWWGYWHQSKVRNNKYLISQGFEPANIAKFRLIHKETRVVYDDEFWTYNGEDCEIPL